MHLLLQCHYVKTQLHNHNQDYIICCVGGLHMLSYSVSYTPTVHHHSSFNMYCLKQSFKVLLWEMSFSVMQTATLICCHALFTLWNMWRIFIQPDNRSQMAAFILVIHDLSCFQWGKRWRLSSWLDFMFVLQWDRLPVAVLHGVEQRSTSVC